VDFLTLHILPYWEDDPVAVEDAVAHVARIRQRMLEHYGKPVLIGETGWPSQGRQREAAKPGRVEQARFIREFVREAHDQGWDYNLIEAIDQPWKRHLEGTAGGYWGMLDTQLNANFPFQGPVFQRASFLPVLAASGAGMLACLFLGLICRRHHAPGALNAAIVGAWLGGALFMVWEHGDVAYRNAWEWGLLGLVALLGVALTLGRVSGQRVSGSFARAWRRRPRRGKWLMSGLRLSIFFAAALAALLLFVDPRYRDFPYWLYLLPLPTLLTLGVSRRNHSGREERILAAVILICGAGRWLMEPGNPEAQAWGALCLLLGVCGFSGGVGRARISRASSAAKAEASKQ
jgi:glucan 1,3-beta-glucosidase